MLEDFLNTVKCTKKKKKLNLKDDQLHEFFAA